MEQQQQQQETQEKQKQQDPSPLRVLFDLVGRKRKLQEELKSLSSKVSQTTSKQIGRATKALWEFDEFIAPVQARERNERFYAYRLVVLPNRFRRSTATDEEKDFVSRLNNLLVKEHTPMRKYPLMQRVSTRWAGYESDGIVFGSDNLHELYPGVDLVTRLHVDAGMEFGILKVDLIGEIMSGIPGWHRKCQHANVFRTPVLDDADHASSTFLYPGDLPIPQERQQQNTMNNEMLKEAWEFVDLISAKIGCAMMTLPPRPTSDDSNANNAAMAASEK